MPLAVTKMALVFGDGKAFGAPHERAVCPTMRVDPALPHRIVLNLFYFHALFISAKCMRFSINLLHEKKIDGLKCGTKHGSFIMPASYARFTVYGNMFLYPAADLFFPSVF